MVSEKSKANLKTTPFQAGTSAPVEAQKLSVQKRKENRTMRQIMLDKFKYKGLKEEGIDALIEKYRKGDLAAFDRVRDVLNESDDEGREKEPIFNLVVSNDTADILKKIIQ